MKNVTLRAGAVLLAVATAFGIGGATAAPASAFGSSAPQLPALPPLPPLPDELAFLLPQPPVKDKLDKSFASLQKSMAKTLPGGVGLAVTPVGSSTTLTFGTVTTGRAWSTMKIPVSLAAERVAGPEATYSTGGEDAEEIGIGELEDKAITVSDNDSAEALWGYLGGGHRSVDAVTSVLREGGDHTTRVSSELDTPKSYPGHTRWTVADQSRFGAHLPCMSGSENILDLMGSVGANQRWGVASRKAGLDAAVKGGWGPATSDSGKHVVRQIGVVTTSRGRFAVSMIALPRNGSFSTATAMLDRVGEWVGKNVSSMPVGRCGFGHR